jgi:hypothetical protein
VPLAHFLWLLLVFRMFFQPLQIPFLYFNSLSLNLQAAVQISQPYIKMPSTTLHNILFCVFNEIRLLQKYSTEHSSCLLFCSILFHTYFSTFPASLKWILIT